MKKLVLLLSLLTCVFTLSACAPEIIESEYYDITDSMTRYYYEMFSQATEEQLESIIEAHNSQLAETNEEALAYKGGARAWLNAVSELGEFVGESGFTQISVQDEYMGGTLTVEYSERSVDFTVTANKHTYELISIKVAPHYTTGERMATAGLNTLMGMGTVFVLLIVIAFIIGLFKYINKAETYFINKKAAQEKTEQKNDFVPVDVSKAPVMIEEEEIDDLELIAVITAAIAASMNTSVDQLVVRSIKKKNTNKWNKA